MSSEAKYKLMTEQLRLINSDEDVAGYIKWIISNHTPESKKPLTVERIEEIIHEYSESLFDEDGQPVDNALLCDHFNSVAEEIHSEMTLPENKSVMPSEEEIEKILESCQSVNYGEDGSYEYFSISDGVEKIFNYINSLSLPKQPEESKNVCKCQDEKNYTRLICPNCTYKSPETKTII